MTRSNPFEAIHGEQFVVLTTYRRNGEPVPTTVWFAAYDGKLYVTTNRNLGKYKRILANAAVTVAASDRAGNVSGRPIAGRARALDEAEYEQARSALLDKYGETYRSMTEQMDARLPPGSRTYIEIETA
ncbi:MAG TPA: PPOX class F420-dependent oxidoreductase [Roseiflexaceae bacterium]|nr:PPOX class F420-dependent oxidoreductase [Roseiflexaceae bacterium]